MMIKLSQDEAEIYDRQIRLWGVDAQQRIQNASVLVAGVRALSNELCKNLALAGIGSITLLDDKVVDDDDLGVQFFLEEGARGKNRAEAVAPAIRALNPRVKVEVDPSNVADKPDSFFQAFDIVCMIHQDAAALIRVNQAVRKADKRIPFYAADAFGWVGYIFCDLAKHEYIEEKEISSSQSEETTTKRIQHVEEYVTLEESLQVDYSNIPTNKLKKKSALGFVMHMILKHELKHNRPITGVDAEDLIKNKSVALQEMGISDGSFIDDDLISHVVSLFDSELVPVTAIVGGVLAQEMIKVLSQKQLPIQNWFYYNGLSDSGMVHCVRNEEKPAAKEAPQDTIVL
ncbi:hypothetical protein O0I10_010385 [Lichtheimia ornata]|uniref:Ubiquitin-like 1-activating enzyme E1A n=1 Tax=Lichtheimia ornata TaxID=688661 RepID=A0AAD7UXH4_9FUNG|nr:uncharacterized protein O0I10_010385 [Lichtheimia ornata]KAJ8653936.1 hypothetical protein O0I10_010385 [Lichtheimia ornata]